MNSRTFVLSLFALILSLSIASAAITITPNSPNSFPTQVQVGQSYSIPYTIQNTENQNVQVTLLKGAVSNADLSSIPISYTVNAGSFIVSSLTMTIPTGASGQASIQIIARPDQTRSDGSTIPVAQFTLNLPINTTNQPVQPAPITGAALSLSTLRTPTLSQNGLFNVTNTGSVALTAVNLSASGGVNILFTGDSKFALAPGASRSVEAVVVGAGSASLGDTTITVTAQDAVAQNAKATQSFSLSKSFCSQGPQSTNLSITNVNIENNDHDDDEWMPLDNIIVTVEVENMGDSNLRNVFVELGLFDSQGRNVIGDLDFDNDDEERLEVDRLDDGDEDEVTFEFQIPGDLDDGDYKLTLKAYIKGSENKVCTDRADDLGSTTHEVISVTHEDDEGKFIAFSDIRLSPTDAVCRDSVTLSALAFNIGEEDQDRVKVHLSNKELNVDVSQEIRSGLDVGDDESITFNFAVPVGTAEKTYNLELTSEYDYRNGNYRQTSDSPQSAALKVFGCTGTSAPQTLLISVTNIDSAIVGDKIVVNAVIRNPSKELMTVLLGASGYQSWSTLESISERTFTLAGGEQKDVRFTLIPTDDASGEEQFTITANSNGAVITRPVTVEFAENESWSFDFKGNTMLWVFGIVNLLLIILIIVVAVRIASR